MKRGVFSIVQLVLLIWSYVYVHAEVNVIDRIVATVNGEIITLSELHKFKVIMYMGEKEKADTAEVERMILTQMIEKKIIAQEAKDLEIEVREKDIDAAIENIVQKNKITLQQMKAHLAQDGIKFEQYRELMKTEILLSEVVGQKVQSRITVTDKDMQAYYEQNIKPQEKPGARVRIQQILQVIPKDSLPETVESIARSAAEIREKIIAGEDFATMAVTYSQGPAAQMGGDLGYFHKGELLPAVEEVAFNLAQGQVSQVVKTSMGFHIIKVLDKDIAEEDRSWRDHQNEIKRILYNQAFDKHYAEWMEGLKKKAYIEVNY